jgi:hypothetical protein
MMDDLRRSRDVGISRFAISPRGPALVSRLDEARRQTQTVDTGSSIDITTT